MPSTADPYDDVQAGLPAEVLIVDDDEWVRRAVARLLEQEGFAVTVFDDPVAALERARTRRFAVVVSDISMPDMTGVELLRAIRALDTSLPVIFLTGLPTLETAAAAVELGAYRYLTKPFDEQELLSAVRTAGDVSRLTRLNESAAFLRQTRPSGHHATASVVSLEQVDEAIARAWLAAQPIVGAKRETRAYEVLLRSRSVLLPNAEALLQAAEAHGASVRLARRVRELAACRLDEADEGVGLFVNLCPADLLDDHLYDPAAPLSPLASRVVLEITERDSLDEVPRLRERVQELRRMGYRIALDDLGAGYSGLTNLVGLDPDIVKLDRELVAGLDADQRKHAVIASILSVCAELEIDVVAEGIETAAEFRALRNLGCPLYQGYAIARPGEGFPHPHPEEAGSNPPD